MYEFPEAAIASAKDKHIMFQLTKWANQEFDLKFFEA
jgi:hypothetical protein